MKLYSKSRILLCVKEEDEERIDEPRVMRFVTLYVFIMSSHFTPTP
jgi:hypothetical protein